MQLAKRSADMPGLPRTSWPELVGRDQDVAHSTISRDRPDLRVISRMVGEPEPPTVENDRVIIWLETNNSWQFIVAQVPYIG